MKQRTNELGIRMTLGASRSDILKMALREGAQRQLLRERYQWSLW